MRIIVKETKTTYMKVRTGEKIPAESKQIIKNYTDAYFWISKKRLKPHRKNMERTSFSKRKNVQTMPQKLL